MSGPAVPPEFVCPITSDVFHDPVIGTDGQTYERAAIVEWLSIHHQSPITRQAMEVSDLVPNYALKSMIDAFLSGNSTAPQSPIVTGPISVPSCVPLSDLQLKAEIRDNLVHVAVIPPTAGPKVPCSIICMLDVSGSMGTDASVQNGQESDGLSRLDIVKHSVNTIIHTMEDEDELAIISFSQKAKVVQPLIRMDRTGKERALRAVKTLQPGGQTNIWDALRVAIELSKGKTSSLVLFTDGEPNVDPPRGILPTLQDFLTDSNFLGCINTFGFGYQLDSSLLFQISVMGDGIYGYIPEASMVGTVFVNFASNALSTCARGLKLSVGSKTAKISSVQFGQSRDFVFPAATLPDASIVVLEDGQERKHAQCEPFSDNLAWNLQLSRSLFIDKVNAALHAPSDAKTTLDALKAALVALGPGNEHFVRDIESANSSEGQVSKALLNIEWFTKWGRHYIPSLLRAHDLQQCANFRDPSVQQYGGTSFKQVQKRADTLFCSIPPPEPEHRQPEYHTSRAAALNSTASPPSRISMAAYYDAGGVCFNGSALVSLKDGLQIRVEDLRKGHILANGAVVDCVVETILQHPVRMIDMGAVLVTPWHPMIWQGNWVFPGEQFPHLSCVARLSSVFNVVLSGGHQISVGGFDFISMGHDLCGPVVGHEFFGSLKVVRALSVLDGWEDGIVKISSAHIVRDPATHQIVDICRERVEVIHNSTDSSSRLFRHDLATDC